MRANHPDSPLRHTEPQKQILQFLIYADNTVESPKDEAAEGERVNPLSSLRTGIAPGMKAEHCFASRDQAADKSEHHQSRGEVAADVQVNDVVPQPGEKFQRLKRVPGVIDSI